MEDFSLELLLGFMLTHLDLAGLGFAEIKGSGLVGAPPGHAFSGFEGCFEADIGDLLWMPLTVCVR